MEHIPAVILGGGIAAIAAGWQLRQCAVPAVIYEQHADWGGLCGYFECEGFRFDRFVHLQFTRDPQLRELFERSSPLMAHPPLSYNYYHGAWLKHPALTNLAALPPPIKAQIINDFVSRPQLGDTACASYEHWLLATHGAYFTEHFALPYTRKYWGQSGSALGTDWIGPRIYAPELIEVLLGSYAESERNFYYTDAMYYPRRGGFRSLLDSCRSGLDIRCRHRVIAIDPVQRRVSFADGSCVTYNVLISSLPLPDMTDFLDGCPASIRAAAQQLDYTCGYQISWGFKRPDIPRYLWFYIYDEDIPPARVHSPSLKSPDNVPPGCSALQAEVYFDARAQRPDPQLLLDTTRQRLMEVCGFTRQDIVVEDIRFEPYANVTFTHGTAARRQLILDYLRQLGIISIGRFGTWDYLWSFQAFSSGREGGCLAVKRLAASKLSHGTAP